MVGVEGRATEILDRHRVAFVSLAIAALTLLAWSNRFIQDDAFITFRYAQNLAEGAGLTWNPGERVEGYTNFLWALLLVVPFRLGIDPVVYSQAVGLLLFPGSLYFTYRIALSATGSPPTALLALLLLGTNYTFSSYATGGLETQLLVFMLLGATALSIFDGESSGAQPGRPVVISLFAASALLTRMDSALYLGCLYGYVFVLLVRQHPGQPAVIARRLALLIVPGATIVMLWLAWKLWYYGDIMPNTYYAKMIEFSDAWRPGLGYIWTFVRAYWLLPVALLPVVFWKRAATHANRELALLALLCAVGFLYAIKIGGDFMEFRALVAVLPALFVLVAWVGVSVVPWRALSLVVTVLVVAASFQHARTFEARDGVESVERLEGHIYGDYRSWAQVGELLGEIFGNAEEPVVIATSAAGAIPFYSGLEAVDMHGLTDPWIAKNGDVYDPPYSMLGHHKVSPFSYLVERGVNLVIGHPWVAERKPGPRPPFGSLGLARFNIYDAPLADSVPGGAVMKVLEINLDERQRLYVLYLMRSDSIDAVLAELDIRRHTVRLKRRPG